MSTRHLIAYLLLALMAGGLAVVLFHAARKWLRRWQGRRRSARRHRKHLAEGPPTL